MRNAIIAAIAVLIIGGLGVWSSLPDEAEAANYSNDYDWDVKRTTDIPDDGKHQEVFHWLYLGKCTPGSQGGCPTKGTTSAVTPTFTNIDCYAGDGGRIYARFRAETDEISELSWPSTVSCSYTMGSNTFTANIDLHTNQSDFWATYDTSGWTPSAGVVFDFDPVASGSHVSPVTQYRHFPLPNSATYIETNWKGKQGSGSGTDWTGVVCYVRENGTSDPDSLLVSVDENAAAGTGWCPVQRSGQSTLNVAITIDRP